MTAETDTKLATRLFRMFTKNIFHVIFFWPRVDDNT